MKKADYIRLMDRVLDAYSAEHIDRFYGEVKEHGIKEHGFPRVVANIGILLSHGKRLYLKEKFKEMMDFTTENLIHCKKNMLCSGGNEFSVREICLSLREVEKALLFSDEVIANWKENLKRIVPATCYTDLAVTRNDIKFNWALFGAVSEQARKIMKLASEDDFIELQTATQLLRIDVNGMYEDALEYPPMVYDVVPRMLFSLLLTLGYEGEHKEAICELLEKSSEPTLKMQSVTGELAFGGRSNGFLHNECVFSALLEFYASWYKKKGNTEKSNRFKEAAHRAVEKLSEYLSYERITHVKNRFDITSSYGCEDYAYFDKYMITSASMLFNAYLMCDDDIEVVEEEVEPYVYLTAPKFHKAFLRCGDYFAEIELEADSHYDASGIGRLHKKGAPSEICLSFPGTENPSYYIGRENKLGMSLAAGHKDGENSFYSLTGKTKYEVVKTESTKDYAFCELSCRFENGTEIKEEIKLTKDGLKVHLEGSGELLFILPAISTDGENEGKANPDGEKLTVEYRGHKCLYTVNGKIRNTGEIVGNRSGLYDIFEAYGKDKLDISVVIE